MLNIAIVRSESLSSKYESRFVVINEDTGKILDDAQGYGYKTAQKAHAAWAYKTRDKSKDAKKSAHRKHIQKWLKEHNDFCEAMDTYALEIAKGSCGEDAKFDAKFVKDMLEQSHMEVDFTAGELLRVWEKM